MNQKAYTFPADGSSKMSEGPVPGAMEAAVAAAREALVEMVAEADETLMEHFFEAGTLTQEELVSGLKSATAAGKLFPVICASGLQNVGAQPLLDAVLTFLPSPAERPFQALAGGQTGLAARPTKPPPTRRSSGRRWRTSSPAGSRCSGSIRAS